MYEKDTAVFDGFIIGCFLFQALRQLYPSGIENNRH
jgi:hypothetical protein